MRSKIKITVQKYAISLIYKKNQNLRQIYSFWTHRRIFWEFLDNWFSCDHAKSFDKNKFRREHYKVYLYLFEFIRS